MSEDEGGADVLLVCGDPADADRLRRCLSRRGPRPSIATAFGADDALDCLRRRGRHARVGWSGRPGLILVSMRPADGDAARTLARVRSGPRARRVPALIVARGTECHVLLGDVNRLLPRRR